MEKINLFEMQAIAGGISREEYRSAQEDDARV